MRASPTSLRRMTRSRRAATPVMSARSFHSTSSPVRLPIPIAIRGSGDRGSRGNRPDRSDPDVECPPRPTLRSEPGAKGARTTRARALRTCRCSSMTPRAPCWSSSSASRSRRSPTSRRCAHIWSSTAPLREAARSPVPSISGTQGDGPFPRPIGVLRPLAPVASTGSRPAGE